MNWRFWDLYFWSNIFWGGSIICYSYIDSSSKSKHQSKVKFVPDTHCKSQTLQYIFAEILNPTTYCWTHGVMSSCPISAFAPDSRSLTERTSIEICPNPRTCRTWSVGLNIRRGFRTEAVRTFCATPNGRRSLGNEIEGSLRTAQSELQVIIGSRGLP